MKRVELISQEKKRKKKTKKKHYKSLFLNIPLVVFLTYVKLMNEPVLKLQGVLCNQRVVYKAALLLLGNEVYCLM